MQLTLPHHLLKRELGERPSSGSVRELYGDRAWIDDLDIVNELGGHSGCVNALWLVDVQLVDLIRFSQA